MPSADDAGVGPFPGAPGLRRIHRGAAFGPASPPDRVARHGFARATGRRSAHVGTMAGVVAGTIFAERNVADGAGPVCPAARRDDTSLVAVEALQGPRQ